VVFTTRAHNFGWYIYYIFSHTAANHTDMNAITHWWIIRINTSVITTTAHIYIYATQPIEQQTHLIIYHYTLTTTYVTRTQSDMNAVTHLSYHSMNALLALIWSLAKKWCDDAPPPVDAPVPALTPKHFSSNNAASKGETLVSLNSYHSPRLSASSLDSASALSRM